MAEDDTSSATPHGEAEEKEEKEGRKLKKSGSSDDMNDTQRMISYISHRFSNLDIDALNSLEAIEDLLGIAQEDIQIWDSDESMIWESKPGEAFRYLRAVEELQKLTGSLETFRWTEDVELQSGILCRAHSVVHMAMTKLEYEFIHLLTKYLHVPQLDATSFRSDGGLSLTLTDEYNYSHRSFESYPNVSTMIADLTVPNVRPDIRCIAQVMFNSNYGRECCQAYVGVRRDVLDECLNSLLGEILSIEQIVLMDWKILNSKIHRWKKVAKNFVNVCLVREKNLCDHIFEYLPDEPAARYFFESSKASIYRLFKFGEAVSVIPSTPEKLFEILDMYDVLGELIPEIKSLFENTPDSSCSSILSESQHVRFRLGESAKSVIECFKHDVQKTKSTVAFPGGGIHPFTKYVMNFVSTLSAYTETLENLLGVEVGNTIQEEEEEDAEEERLHSSHRVSTVLLRSLIKMLESNLEAKASLYQDISLQRIFKMNNIHYMVNKVMANSELRVILGDEWIRSHCGEYVRCASGYQRITWNPIISLLIDERFNSGNEGTNNIHSSSRNHQNHQRPPKMLLKERLKRFNAMFEDTYKTHTAWNIPNPNLRLEMQINIAQNLLHAYRTVMGRHSAILDGFPHPEKYLKYSTEDLENYTTDLFTGNSKSLNPTRRGA